MTAISAMQKWLALEHEAVWLYPLVGARFVEVITLSRRTSEAHLVTRDDLLERLYEAGADPVATALAYDVGPLTSVAEARTAVRRVETRIAAACLTLVGEASGELRDFATSSLRRAALDELAWGGPPRAFPGLP